MPKLNDWSVTNQIEYVSCLSRKGQALKYNGLFDAHITNYIMAIINW